MTYLSSAAVRSSDAHQAIVYTRGVPPDAIDGGAERSFLGEIEGCSKNRHDLSGRKLSLQYHEGHWGPVEGIVKETGTSGFVPWMAARAYLLSRLLDSSWTEKKNVGTFSGRYTCGRRDEAVERRTRTAPSRNAWQMASECKQDQAGHHRRLSRDGIYWQPGVGPALPTLSVTSTIRRRSHPTGMPIIIALLYHGPPKFVSRLVSPRLQEAISTTMCSTK